MPLRRLLLGFIAGFMSVLVVHQSVIWTGGKLGLLAGGRGWSVTPVPPFGVPQVFSLAFWGGVWGIVLALVAPRLGRGTVGWVVAILVFGLATTLVGWYVVGPLKGRAVDPLTLQRILTGLVINGSWALGAYGFLRLFDGASGER